jgi:hypothetical protein
LKRILNTSGRGIGLRNGGVSVKLPVGGFCKIEDAQWGILERNKQVQRMHYAKLFAVTDGSPLNKEIELKKRTAVRDMPEQFRPKGESATHGKSKPVEVQVDSVEVAVPKVSGKGKQVKAKVSDK